MLDPVVWRTLTTTPDVREEDGVSNAQITRDVLDELLWDTGVDASRITVITDNGTVILGGTVAHFHQKWNALEDARQVKGVCEVIDHIEIERAHNVPDAVLETSARAGLDANGLVSPGAVKVTVSDGWVTMTGNVHHHYERQSAELVIRQLRGLRGFTDLVTVSADTVREVSSGIAHSLARNAAVDANTIKVTESGGVVTLEGTVRSYAEKREAQNSAWRSPGVVRVNDQLVVVATTVTTAVIPTNRPSTQRKENNP